MEDLCLDWEGGCRKFKFETKKKTKNGKDFYALEAYVPMHPGGNSAPALEPGYVPPVGQDDLPY